MKRPRAHEIDEEAKNFLRNFFSPLWIVEEVNPDYGLDFRITIVEDKKVTEKFFLVQLKGTDSIKSTKDYIVYDIDVQHLLVFNKILAPILFIIYDTQSHNGYWINIQKYCREILDDEDPNWINQKYKRIRIPKDQQLNDLNVIKKVIINAIKENLRFFTDRLEWHEGYERSLDNIEKIEELINKDEINAIKKRIHASILYFKMDDLDKMQEQFFAIYRQHRNDENHLQAILAILTSSNLFSIFDIRPLLRLCEEGHELAKQLNLELYFDIFTFFKNYYISFSLIKQKLPVLISRVQSINKSIPVDYYIKLIWDFENAEISRKLREVNKKIMEILNKIIKNGNIYEFLILQLYIIQVEVFLNYTLKPYLENEMFIQSLDQHLPLIKNILKIVEKLSEEDLLLQSYLIIGGYFELMDLNKGKDLYLKGLELAKKINHQHYIRRFNYNIKHLGEEFKPFTLDDIKDSLLSTNVKILRQGFSNIESITDPHLRGAIRIALDDLDPIKYLKFCEFLVIAYNPSLLGKAYGLYSLGWKEIGCIKKEVSIKPGNLSNLFELFNTKYCKDCKLIKPRSNDYNPPMKMLEEMFNSIIHIEDKKYSN